MKPKVEFVGGAPSSTRVELLVAPINVYCSVFFFVELQDVMVKWKPLRHWITLFFNHISRWGGYSNHGLSTFIPRKIFCSSYYHSKINLLEYVFKLALDLFTYFNEYKPSWKKKFGTEKMKTSLWSKWGNKLNAKAVRSANQQQVFLALDLLGNCNFYLQVFQIRLR